MSVRRETYVNLRQSEYNRLMKSCHRLDNVENSMKASMKKLSKKLQDVEQEQNRQIQKQELQFQNALKEARLGQPKCWLHAMLKMPVVSPLTPKKARKK